MKFLLTMTLKEGERNNPRLIKENSAEDVYKLKQQSGQAIFITGSDDLVPYAHAKRSHQSRVKLRDWCGREKNQELAGLTPTQDFG